VNVYIIINQSNRSGIRAIEEKGSKGTCSKAECYFSLPRLMGVSAKAYEPGA